MSEKRKKILVINGHPDPESYNNALANAYKIGVAESEAEFVMIHIRDLVFDPNLAFGYRKRMELEPDLLAARAHILWCDHIVWIYPVWWGSVPAIMKGFIDRVFLPGFGFQKRENSVWWDKLLKGKTSRIICTMDQPSWFYRLINGAPSHLAMKKLTMHFMGIKPVRITAIGPLRLSKPAYREKWLRKVEKLGRMNR